MSALPRQKMATGHWQILGLNRWPVAEAVLDPRYPGDREPWHWYTIDGFAGQPAEGRSPLLTNAVAAVYHLVMS